MDVTVKFPIVGPLFHIDFSFSVWLIRGPLVGRTYGLTKRESR